MVSSKTYFICPENASVVKIGKAERPEERIGGVQTGNPLPLYLVGVIDKNIEKELHQRFQDCKTDRNGENKLSGEWFYLTKEIKSYIEHNATITQEGIRILEPKSHTIKNIQTLKKVKDTTAYYDLILDLDRVDCIDDDDRDMEIYSFMESFFLMKAFKEADDLEYCGELERKDCDCEHHMFYDAVEFIGFRSGSIINKIGISKDNHCIYFNLLPICTSNGINALKWLADFGYVMDILGWSSSGEGYIGESGPFCFNLSFGNYYLPSDYENGVQSKDISDLRIEDILVWS